MSGFYFELSPEIHSRIEKMAAARSMSFNDFIIKRATMDIPKDLFLEAGKADKK